MKSITATCLSAFALAPIASAALTAGTTYELKLSAPATPELNAAVTVETDGTFTLPNPLGVYSTGNPRPAYRFTAATSKSDPRFYELKGAVKQTQLVLAGKQIAMALLDVPIGSKVEGDVVFTDYFILAESGGVIRLAHAQDARSDTPTGGAGTWRACKGDSEVDYKLYWYDGHSALQEVVKNCISGLTLEAVPVSASPSSTNTALPSGTWLPGVTRNSSATGSAATSKPTAPTYEGVGQRIRVAGAAFGAVLGAMFFAF